MVTIRSRQVVQGLAALAGTLGLAIAAPASATSEAVQSNLTSADTYAQNSEELDPTDPRDPLQMPEPMEPGAETEPMNPLGESDSSDSTRPTDPRDPLQQADPTEPVENRAPLDPSEGMDPADSTRPTDPRDPLQQADPTEPVEDRAPLDPMEEPGPADSLRPTDPRDPLQTPEPAEQSQPQAVDTSGMTIVEIAASNSAFNTLVQAVQAAELAGTLSGDGPFTVFAPTDAAFAQLPAGALDLLLMPENQDLLQRVLEYHVVPGEVMSSDLSSGKVESLNGGLAVLVTDSSVIVNDASVVQPDIQASNGVIHVVSRVLMPRSLRNDIVARLGS
ncbi:fasciclin domain-containing protein [Almyronema epifaneia]|uniref:Fasciclin domain-containing protein n=1 Tax=Almyronema epifaneia S1 TaxID=2991925 RepID=A0ABW6IJ07_9CYAN